MSRKRRTVQQLPMLPRSYCVEGEDPGVAIQARAIGSADGAVAWTCEPAEGPDQPAYLAWLREQPCALEWTGLCKGRSAAHHEPPKGMGGGRNDDRKAVPLCRGYHHPRRHDVGLLADELTHILSRRIDYYLAWRDGRTGL